MSLMADSPSPDIDTTQRAEHAGPIATLPQPAESEKVEFTVERRRARPQLDVNALRTLNGSPGWARQMADATGRPYKVCIVGFTEHRRLAPFDDPDFQVWGCNKLWQLEDRPFDRIYDPHPIGDIRGTDPAQTEWLARTQTPAYVVAEQPDWPTSITLIKRPGTRQSSKK